jgi:hypothetical protein
LFLIDVLGGLGASSSLFEFDLLPELLFDFGCPAFGTCLEELPRVFSLPFGLVVALGVLFLFPTALLLGVLLPWLF